MKRAVFNYFASVSASCLRLAFYLHVYVHVLCVCAFGCLCYFLANMNCCRLSVCRLSVCRLLSVTLVHPTQVVVNFSNFLWHLVHWPSNDMHRKLYGDRHRGSPPPGELNPRGVAKYRDFGPIEGCISETVQDTR